MKAISKNKAAAVILAAGKGTRMRSDLPKVLHNVCSKPMVLYAVDLANSLKISDSVVVLGFKSDEVKKVLPEGVKTVIQKKVIGTGDAVKRALPLLNGFNGAVLVLYGDTPLLKKETLDALLKRHFESGAAATILTAVMEEPFGYGRILRDEYSAIRGIREEKDCDGFQREIKEINTGIICFDKAKLEAALKKIRPDNNKKEYYLTDVIGILRSHGDIIEGVIAKDWREALGVNSRVELETANSSMRRTINAEYMKKGVTIVDSASTIIASGVSIGQDTVINPFTVIEKSVRIGEKCIVGPFAHIREGARVRNNSVVAGNPSSYNT